MTTFINPYPRPAALRSAVLAVFTQTAHEAASSLSRFSEQDWREHLQWLDVSGLALYLLERLRAREQQHLLPTSVMRRLEQNLVDNRVRNADLLAEAAEINRQLQREGVLFANLKGITLTPESVPDPGLRCQLDLDFLVLTDHADMAARVLERLGYTRECVSGDTWEFKAGQRETARLRDLYKTKPQRCAELHLTNSMTMLSRLHIRTYAQTPFPVLSPPDLYLAQAMHLFKHVCSSFTRAAWLLEFQTHTTTRREDDLFWRQLEELVENDPAQRVALGVAGLLLEQSFGEAPPPGFTKIVEDAVSVSVCLWITRYGQAALLANFPGTKLYLLLKNALQPTHASARRERRSRLLPTRLPPMITQSYAGETLFSRLGRYRIQAVYLFLRLRFHSVEGTRYAIESTRFRRILTGVAH